MEAVRLETSTGEYVTTAIMPPFKLWPEVLIWGERVFLAKTTILKAGVVRVYREGFAVAVVQTRQDS